MIINMEYLNFLDVAKVEYPPSHVGKLMFLIYLEMMKMKAAFQHKVELSKDTYRDKNLSSIDPPPCII